MRVSKGLFDEVVGYDDVKDLFVKALRMYGDGLPVHFLMVGPPASAKTAFLLCLAKLKRSLYVLGSRVSRAGLSGVLIENKPRVLLIDELDKMDGRDYAVLLSLCESGRVVECLHRRFRVADLETLVFASANELAKIPSELLSRFTILRFKEYSQQEFMKIVRNLLVKRERIKPRLARYIGKCVWNHLHSKDVRDAIRLARLVRKNQTKWEVKRVVKTLKRYN